MHVFKGKCLAFDSKEGLITLRVYPNQHHFDVKAFDRAEDPLVGSFVEVDLQKKSLRVLGRPPSANPSWSDHVFHPRRIKGTAVREHVEAGIREFFLERDFREVRTPILVVSPGMEPHIRPFKVGDAGYLQTSPEFAMKKLLAGGLERIFQTVSCFRDEPRSKTHSPEFTMLEWYRTFEKIESIMADTESLVEHLAMRVLGVRTIRYQSKNISVKTPWERLPIYDLFESMCKIDLRKASSREALAEEAAKLGVVAGSGDTWDDLYFKIWMDHIEPKLPEDRAVIVHGYPASQSALAEIEADSRGTRIARRFEFYCGGLELGNAFQELTDPVEQRWRFEKDMLLRKETYGDSFPVTPIDEMFMKALEEGLPPSSGIAVGVDRLIMLLADETEIQYTQWV